MAQRRYAARVVVTVFVDEEGDVADLEIAEQRWGKVPHLVSFLDVGPFAPTSREHAAIEAAVSSSLRWLVEDAWPLDAGRML